MKSILPILIAVSTLFNSYAQIKEINYLSPENRKGQVFYKVGAEYRITPLPSNAILSNNVFVNTDKQNSGTAFFYTLDLFVTKNLSLGFSHTFRYDEVGGLSSGIEGNFGTESTPKALIQGYHFYADYHFKVFRNSELFLRLGRSLINRGTEITVKETFFDDQGNQVLSATGTVDYAYEPWNFAAGWKKRKLEIILGFYTSNISEYFITDEAFIIPYFKFSYNLGRL
jgi:hypothetical protein